MIIPRPQNMRLSDEKIGIKSFKSKGDYADFATEYYKKLAGSIEVEQNV